jgi:hypothetical protein
MQINDDLYNKLFFSFFGDLGMYEHKPNLKLFMTKKYFTQEFINEMDSKLQYNRQCNCNKTPLTRKEFKNIFQFLYILHRSEYGFEVVIQRILSPEFIKVLDKSKSEFVGK